MTASTRRYVCLAIIIAVVTFILLLKFLFIALILSLGRPSMLCVCPDLYENSSAQLMPYNRKCYVFTCLQYFLCILIFPQSFNNVANVTMCSSSVFMCITIDKVLVMLL